MLLLLLLAVLCNAQAPTPVLYDPGNRQTDVSPTDPLYIEFSDPMNSASCQTAYTLYYVNPVAKKINGTFEWRKFGARMYFIPSSPLPLGTLHFVHVNKSCTGLSPSVQIAQEIDFVFWTVYGPQNGGPTVQAFDPVFQQIDVAPTTLVSVRFNTSMRRTQTEAALSLSTVEIMTLTETYHPGAFNWSSDNTTVTLSPITPLPFATRGYVKVTTAGRDSANRPLAQGVTSIFDTIVPDGFPAIATSLPANNSVNVDILRTFVALLFDKRMYTGSIAGLALRDEWGYEVTTGWVWSADPRNASLALQPQDLWDSSDYTITVTDEVLSATGTPSRPQVFKFRTSATNLFAPGLPTLTVVAAGPLSVLATWHGGKGGRPTSYELQQLIGGSWVTVVTTSAVSAVVPVSSCNTAYSFQVRGVNIRGPGPFSLTSTATTLSSGWPVLSFQVQPPTAALAGTPLGIQPQVALRDVCGPLIADSSTVITLSLGTGNIQSSSTPSLTTTSSYSASSSVSLTPLPSSSPSPTTAPSLSLSPSSSASNPPSLSLSPSPTVTPTASLSPGATPSNTPTNAVLPSLSLSSSASVTPSQVSPSPSRSLSVTVSASLSASTSVSATRTRTPVASPLPQGGGVLQGGAISGTLSGGVLQFSGLEISYPGNYTIIATDTARGLSVASSWFLVLPASISRSPTPTPSVTPSMTASATASLSFGASPSNTATTTPSLSPLNATSAVASVSPSASSTNGTAIIYFTPTPSRSPLPDWAIILLAVLGALFVLALLLLIYCCCCRKKRRKKSSEEGSEARANRQGSEFSGSNSEKRAAQTKSRDVTRDGISAYPVGVPARPTPSPTPPPPAPAPAPPPAPPPSAKAKSSRYSQRYSIRSEYSRKPQTDKATAAVPVPIESADDPWSESSTSRLDTRVSESDSRVWPRRPARLPREDHSSTDSHYKGMYAARGDQQDLPGMPVEQVAAVMENAAWDVANLLAPGPISATAAREERRRQHDRILDSLRSLAGDVVENPSFSERSESSALDDGTDECFGDEHSSLDEISLDVSGGVPMHRDPNDTRGPDDPYARAERDIWGLPDQGARRATKDQGTDAEDLANRPHSERRGAGGDWDARSMSSSGDSNNKATQTDRRLAAGPEDDPVLRDIERLQRGLGHLAHELDFVTHLQHISREVDVSRSSPGPTPRDPQRESSLVFKPGDISPMPSPARPQRPAAVPSLNTSRISPDVWARAPAESTPTPREVSSSSELS